MIIFIKFHNKKILSMRRKNINNRNIRLMFLDALASILALYLAFLLGLTFFIQPMFLEIFYDWVFGLHFFKLLHFIFQVYTHEYGVILVCLIFMQSSFP